MKDMAILFNILVPVPSTGFININMLNKNIKYVFSNVQPHLYLTTTQNSAY